jgi:hypothetical protein
MNEASAPAAPQRAPLSFTVEMACWLMDFDKPTTLLDLVKHGKYVAAGNLLSFYGSADTQKFGKYLRVGTVQMTVNLAPEDEQVAMAVTSLRAQLEQARAEWLTKQQAILAEISKLQALPFEGQA